MALRDVVVLQDHLGLTERIRALRDAHPCVVPVCPSYKQTPWCSPVDPPLGWMTEEELPIERKGWLKADAMGLASAVAHAPEADFYWFIESDACASQDRWKALFHEFRNHKADCLATHIHYRGDDMRMETYFDLAPDGASKHFMMALYRLSRAAVEASIAEAPSLRECFSEIAVPWVIQKHGLRLSRINGVNIHFNGMTFRTKGASQRPRPDLLNHPIKLNTYGL